MSFVQQQFDEGVARYADKIPIYTMQALREYVLEGIPVGHFLGAVLDNDLFEAFGRADPENVKALHDIVRFIYNHVPSAARDRHSWLAQFAEKTV